MIPARPVRLCVVCSQYDRRQYPRAVERLVTLLGGLGSIETTFVIVDNAQPGNWYHEVSPQLIHLGGDNSCREFSAFEKALAFLEASESKVDVYAFVTDAYTAYGDEFLELIDGRTVQACLDLAACVGWIDSFNAPLRAFGYDYRDWARTSFLFVPASVLPRITPINFPIAEEGVFGPDAATPFREDGELSPSLRQHFLAWLTTRPTEVSREDAWHSRFDLTDDTFELFRSKVCAILREHLLSARLLHAGIPCFDFRLVAQLAAKGLRELSPEDRESWQWTRWREAEPWIPARYSLERREVPRRLVHGKPAELVVAGWVASVPQAREVVVEISDRLTVGARCDRLRPDLVAAHPEYDDERCGFELRAELGCLAPGRYDLRFRVPETDIEEELGRLHVVPRWELVARRFFLPERAIRGREIPVAFEGEVLTTWPITGIEALWNGQQAALQPRAVETGRRPNGLRSYDVSLFGGVRLWQQDVQQTLELVLHTTEGAHRWHAFTTLEVDDTPPHSLSLQQIGARNPLTGTTPVHLKGAVVVAEDDTALLFFHEDRLLRREPLEHWRDPGSEIVWFELRGEMPGIPAGEGELRLALESAEGPSRDFARWRVQVTDQLPPLYVDNVEVRPPEKTGEPYILALSGWAESRRGLERLVITVDGVPRGTLEIDILRPDVATHLGQPLSRRLGFFVDQKLPSSLGPGRHVLRIALPSPTESVVLWERSIDFEPATSSIFRIESKDLADLVDAPEPRLRSILWLEGHVSTELDGVQAILYVDHEVVDRRSVCSEGSFFLHHRRAAPGTFPVQVVFETEGRAVYATDQVDCHFTGHCDDSHELEEQRVAFRLFLERFDLERRLSIENVNQLFDLLIARNHGVLPAYVKMFREIGNVLRTSPAGREVKITEPSKSPVLDRSLRVLFACWTVPCLRHGGGVCMRNYLKELSRRHKITIVYCYSVGEEDWIEDVREYADKLIGVKRINRKPPEEDDARILNFIYNEYVQDIGEVIEKELATEFYDLVDYHYIWMYPYVQLEIDAPQVLTIHEEPFSAQINNHSKHKNTSLVGQISSLEALLRTFYLSVAALPRKLEYLMAFTEQDAGTVASFENGSKLFLNGIGVDMEAFEEPARGTRKPARLVILGNYRHPPSVDAARYVAEKVLPPLRRRRRDVELVIVGAFPPPELEELGERDGIRVTGFVDDYRTYLQTATVFVAPIFTGSGMRVKILEAMACGAPVVATSLAMHGIHAVDGEHFLHAEHAEEFVEAAWQCIDDAERAQKIGRRGRELIRERHSSVAMAREREAIWHHIIDDWQHQRSPVVELQRNR